MEYRKRNVIIVKDDLLHRYFSYLLVFLVCSFGTVSEEFVAQVQLTVILKYFYFKNTTLLVFLMFLIKTSTDIID